MSLLHVKEQYLNVNNIKVRYCIAGEGAPLLLIHGLGAMMEYWYKNIPIWAKSYRVIALDLPGFGKSDKPDASYTTDYYVAFLKAFLAILKIREFSMVAHSLGGMLALSYAEKHRAQLKKLILLSNVGFNTQLSWMFRILTIPGLGTFLMHFTRDQYAITLRSHTANPEALTDAFIDNAYEVAKQPHTQEVLLKILRENTSIFGIRQRALTPVQTAFKNLMDLPMQIYWGEQDPILFFSIHTSSARRFLPHVPLISLPQCGHLPQLEKSEIINAGVLEFLA